MSLPQLEYKNLQKEHRINHLTICEQLYRNLGKVPTFCYKIRYKITKIRHILNMFSWCRKRL